MIDYMVLKYVKISRDAIILAIFDILIENFLFWFQYYQLFSLLGNEVETDIGQPKGL